MPNTDEAVIFEDYFIRGFSLPVSSFFQELLVAWAISLCNLPPNAVLHISIFIYLCECWLGIPADTDLF